MGSEPITDQRYTLSPKAATIAPAGATTVQPALLVTTPGPVQTAPAPRQTAPTAVTITSEPGDAEIKPDGAFSGSTPTTKKREV